MMKRPEYLSYEESLGNWACLPWRRDVWEEILEKSRNVLRVGFKRMVPDSFQTPSVMPTDGVRDNSHTPKHKKFHLNMRKSFFEGIGALEQGAWRGCGTFSSGNVQNLPGYNTVEPAIAKPAIYTRGVGPCVLYYRRAVQNTQPSHSVGFCVTSAALTSQ